MSRDIVMPGHFPVDGRSVLDIQSEIIDFSDGSGQFGMSRAVLPAGGRIRLDGAPEGLFAGTLLASGSTGQTAPSSGMRDGFASIEVALMGPRLDPMEETTLRTIEAGIRARTVNITGNPVRLLHGDSRDAICAAFIEGMHDDAIGNMRTRDRGHYLLQSVVAANPSVIDRVPHHNAQRKVKSFPLIQPEPSEMTDIDVLVQVPKNNAGMQQSIVMLEDVDAEYDLDEYVRLHVGSIHFSNYTRTQNGRQLDYPRLRWELAAAESTTRAPDIEQSQLPRLAAILLTTSCVDIAVLATPDEPQVLSTGFDNVRSINSDRIIGRQPS